MVFLRSALYVVDSIIIIIIIIIILFVSAVKIFKQCLQTTSAPDSTGASSQNPLDRLTSSDAVGYNPLPPIQIACRPQAMDRRTCGRQHATKPPNRKLCNDNNYIEKVIFSYHA